MKFFVAALVCVLLTHVLAHQQQPIKGGFKYQTQQITFPISSQPFVTTQVIQPGIQVISQPAQVVSSGPSYKPPQQQSVSSQHVSVPAGCTLTCTSNSCAQNCNSAGATKAAVSGPVKKTVTSYKKQVNVKPVAQAAIFVAPVIKTVPVQQTVKTVQYHSTSFKPAPVPAITVKETFSFGPVPVQVNSKPVQQQKPAPVQQQKPAPVQQQKPAPVQQQKPAPVQQQKPVQQAPKPVQQRSPAPAPQPKPAPAPQPKPAPVQPQKTGYIHPKPAPVQHQKPAPVQQQRPAPVQQQKPAPVQQQKPAPVQQQKPAPVQQHRPAPVPQPKPAPVQPQKPVQVPQPRPAPVEQSKPKPAAAQERHHAPGHTGYQYPDKQH